MKTRIKEIRNAEFERRKRVSASLRVEWFYRRGAEVAEGWPRRSAALQMIREGEEDF